MKFTYSSLGGGFNGISPTVLNSTQQGSSNVAPHAEASQIPLDRMVLRKSFATGKFNNTYILTNNWAQTPFRVAMNAGDLYSRQNEPGGSNQVKGSVGVRPLYSLNLGDGVHSGNGATGNQHYVYDSSIYTTYKRRFAKNKNYNDYSFGGSNNGAYVAIKGIRRF